MLTYLTLSSNKPTNLAVPSLSPALIVGATKVAVRSNNVIFGTVAIVADRDML